MADFEVQGLKELEKALLKLGATEAVKVLASAGRKSMKPVLADAKAGANVKTGGLLASLGIQVKKGRKAGYGVFINVGTVRKKATKKNGGGKIIGAGRKALSQEYGTEKQQAEPFLRPALDNNASKVLSSLKTDLAAGIEKAAKKLNKG